MKNKIILFLLALFLSSVALFNAADAVTIKEKSLADITDIVKHANGNLKIEKHSLLFAERLPMTWDNGYDSELLYHVFTISKDGSVAKHFTMPKHYLMGEMIRDHTSNTMKAIFPAVSSKTYNTYGKNGRTILSFLGGNQPSYNGKSTACIPYNIIETKNKNGALSLEASYTYKYYESSSDESYKLVWGTANMTVPGSNEEIFVYAHSGNMGLTGKMIFDFKKLSSDGASLSTVATYEHDWTTGIRNVAIAAGDFDNNGYNDELAFFIVHNTVEREGNLTCNLGIYKLSYNSSNGSYNVTRTHWLRAGGSIDRYSTNVWEQAAASAFVGDFDGDNQQELAVLYKSFITVADNTGEHPGHFDEVSVYKYDTETKSWNYSFYQHTNEEYDTIRLNYYLEGPSKAVRADVDGDGKDEIVILRFPMNGNEVCVELDYMWGEKEDEESIGHRFPWYPIRLSKDSNKYRLGGRGNNDVLGRSFSGDYLNTHYSFNESFSITAGPLTGRMGKGKLADDIAISYTDSTRRQVWIIKTKADSNGNFTGFEKGVKIYDEPVEISGKYARGALLTADFADEGIILGLPEHRVRNKTINYAGVFEAFPYHVDTVNENGTELRKDKPTNFTFSGFQGYETDGEMSVSYVNKSDTSANQSVMFGTSAVKETIFALGNDDASAGVLGGLQAGKTVSNAIGSFYPQAQAAGSILGGIMDFFTDKIQTVKNETNASAFSKTFESSLETHDRDAVLFYEAPQHIWRYPILNAVMPEWWTDGARLSYEKQESKDVKQGEYLTFSLFDDPRERDGDSLTISAYQPLHEEGNFFSYPNNINKNQVEGYNDNGKLFDTVKNVDLTSSVTYTTKLNFTKAQKYMEEQKEDVERSGLSNLLSTISDWLGIDDISGAPPYTTHNQSFMKTFSTSEELSFRIRGKSSLHYGAASHTLKFIPYVTKEGTMKLATAVELNMNPGSWTPALWREGSLYQKYPDPSLLLPNKFHKNGKEFAPTTDMQIAMSIRGMRFYVPGLEAYVDENLLKGVKYQIKVPLYNASFKDTGKFTVSLSYCPSFDMNADKFPIASTDVELKGWDNTSNSNKGWAEFEWTPSESIESGTYYFFVEIDPNHDLQEVHESRFDLNKIFVDDYGGNNEGFYKFSLTGKNDDRYQAGKTKLSASLSAAAANGKAVYSAGIIGASDSAQTYNQIPEGYVLGRIKLQDSYNIDVLEDYLKSQASPDVPVPVTCEIEYEGDYIFPHVTVVGYNYKDGTKEKYDGDYSKVTEDDIGKTILYYTTTLFPGEYHTFKFMLAPSDVNFEDGTNFELVFPIIPTLAQASEEESSTTEEETKTSEEDSNNNSVSLGSSGGGCGLGFGSLMIFGLLGVTLALKRR